MHRNQEYRQLFILGFYFLDMCDLRYVHVIYSSILYYRKQHLKFAHTIHCLNTFHLLQRKYYVSMRMF